MCNILSVCQFFCFIIVEIALVSISKVWIVLHWLVLFFHCLSLNNRATKKQMNMFGGMVTFIVKGGLSSAKKLLENLEVFTLAESLGGAESLAEHPAIMTHASIPKETRESLGIDDGLIRLSVGLESIEDLISDLDNALK